MAEKFRNKYRVPSARLQNWDYGSNGAYFITICTKKMQHFFGEVVDKNMILNSVGVLAEEYWMEILKQFPDVELGNFQIMPNHMHGILIIDKSVVTNVETRFIASTFNDASSIEAQLIAFNLENKIELIASNLDTIIMDIADRGEAQLIASVPQKDGIGGFAGANNPMLANNISRIVRWYKGRCTFEMRKVNPNFEWHPRFHDHIIRNSESFERIQTYIEENPARWDEDKFHKK